MSMHQLFRKGQILTIPNLLSLFRLLLVPVIVWAYIGLDNVVLTIILLAVSALTDVLDGQIARRFNMVSDLGKALDPVADKLTQVCMILCMAFKYPLMWILLGLCVFRESVMLVLGYLNIRKTGVVSSAKWYGKVSTVFLYATALALLFFPKMPQWLSTTLIVLCMIVVVLALVLYTRFFLGRWRDHKTAQQIQESIQDGPEPEKKSEQS